MFRQINEGKKSPPANSSSIYGVFNLHIIGKSPTSKKSASFILPKLEPERSVHPVGILWPNPNHPSSDVAICSMWDGNTLHGDTTHQQFICFVGVQYENGGVDHTQLFPLFVIEKNDA